MNNDLLTQLPPLPVEDHAMEAEKSCPWGVFGYADGTEPVLTLDCWVPWCHNMLESIWTFFYLGRFSQDTQQRFHMALADLVRAWQEPHPERDRRLLENLTIFQGALLREQGRNQHFPIHATHMHGSADIPNHPEDRPTIWLNSLFMPVDMMIRPAAFRRPMGRPAYHVRYRALCRARSGGELAFPHYGYGEANWRAAFIAHVLMPLGPPLMHMNQGVTLDGGTIVPASVLLGNCLLALAPHEKIEYLGSFVLEDTDGITERPPVQGEHGAGNERAAPGGPGQGETQIG